MHVIGHTSLIMTSVPAVTDAPGFSAEMASNRVATELTALEESRVMAQPAPLRAAVSSLPSGESQV